MSRPSCQVHSHDNCPPLCRHRAGVLARPILQILHEWRQNFLELEWMVNRMGAPSVVNDDSHDEDHIEKMRGIYREYGWPDNFLAAECRDALAEMSEDDDDDD